MFYIVTFLYIDLLWIWNFYTFLFWTPTCLITFAICSKTTCTEMFSTADARPKFAPFGGKVSRHADKLRHTNHVQPAYFEAQFRSSCHAMSWLTNKDPDILFLNPSLNLAFSWSPWLRAIIPRTGTASGKCGNLNQSQNDKCLHEHI